MKRFIAMILTVSAFFLGLATLIEKAGAKFRSDEKALALIAAARNAIGGDAAIAGVQSLHIVGQDTRSLNINGVSNTVQGETEINLLLPDKLIKMTKAGDGLAGTAVDKTINVVVSDKGEAGKLIVKGVGTDSGVEIPEPPPPGSDVSEVNTSDGKKIIIRSTSSGNAVWKADDGDAKDRKELRFRVARDQHQDNELFNLTLGLLLSSPKGADVSYTYGGEGDVDGTACDIVIADLAGSTVKLFLNHDTSLPAAISYTAEAMPKVFHLTRPVPGAAPADQEVVMFKRDDVPDESAEYQLKFADYRSVNGVQFPYRWTTTVNGSVDSTFEVSAYEVNPPNIADKFKDEKVLVRVKPDGK